MLQRGNLDPRGDMGERIGTNGTGNGVVSRVALVAAGIEGKRQAAVVNNQRRFRRQQTGRQRASR